MSKKSPPKALSAQEQADLDEKTQVYFQAKHTVVNHEIREFAVAHEFDKVESVLSDFGEFLMRHPEAV